MEEDSHVTPLIGHILKPALFCCIIPCLLFSCSSEKQSGLKDKPPAAAVGLPAPSQTEEPAKNASYTMDISPLYATRNTTLSLNTRGFSVQDATIEWLVNGRPSITDPPNQFKANETKTGDTVHARAVIQGKEILSNVVQIKNSPPEITSLKMIPDLPNSLGTLSAEVAGTDADGDPITYTYEWTRNGKAAGTGKQMEGHPKRGDIITVKVTPSDGEVYGDPAILRAEIRNTPPVIVEDRQLSFIGGVYTHQIRAVDPDGDLVAYALQQAPKGMAIDKSTGLITWAATEKDSGTHHIVLKVSDGHGGDVLYSFELNLAMDRSR